MVGRIGDGAGVGPPRRLPELSVFSNRLLRLGKAADAIVAAVMDPIERKLLAWERDERDKELMSANSPEVCTERAGDMSSGSSWWCTDWLSCCTD